MAIQRLTIDGYGQLELNNAAFRRDGRIEAQCALDPTDFADKKAENGMLLAVNNIARTVGLPKSGNIYPVAINYSAEHMYDERANGLKDFALGINDYYPRLGYLSRGDKFTTNTICYDSDEFDSDDTLKTALESETMKGTPVYGTEHESGAIKVTKTAPEDGAVKLLVTKKFTMPDGQFGVQFQVL